MKENKLISYFAFTLIFCSILIGPFITSRKVRAQPPGRECSTNLMLVLDTSGSMGTACGPSQDRAKDFLDVFMADPTWQNYAGVVHFGSAGWPNHCDSVLSQGLIDDLATVKGEVSHSCPGNTPTESGIVLATEELLEEAAKPIHAGVPMAMIIVTDGGPNCCAGDNCYCRTSGPPCDSGDTCDSGACATSWTADAIAAANTARAAGIRVFVIGFGDYADDNRGFNRSLADDACTDISPTPPAYPPDCLWEAPEVGDLPSIFNEIFLEIADKDGDGFVSDECGGLDEDDTNSSEDATGPCVNPDAPEQAYCINPGGTCPGENGPNVCSVRYYCETWQCSLNCNDTLDNDQDDAIDMNDTGCPAPSGLVPCGRARDNPRTKEDERNSCTLCHIFLLMKWIIDFLVKVITLPLVVLMALIGGFLFITATGSESRIRMGKNIIKTAVIAAVIVLTGWIIINTALFFLTGEQEAGIAKILGEPWNQVQCTVATQECAAPAVDPPRCD